jgi:hypothetical protein
MTYSIGWLTPGRVIDVVLPDVCDDAALAKFDLDVNEMLNTVSEPVHVLVDVRSIKTYPSAQTSIKMTYYKNPQLGRLLVIGLTSNPILRFLAGLITRGVGIQLRDFSTREEALSYLATIETP